MARRCREYLCTRPAAEGYQYCGQHLYSIFGYDGGLSRAEKDVMARRSSQEEMVMVQEVDQVVDDGRGGGRQGGFFFNLPADITAKLEEYAAREERTPRGQVQYIVRQWVKQQEMMETHPLMSSTTFGGSTYKNQSNNTPSSEEE